MFPFGSQQVADEEPFHHPRKETGILKIEEIRGLKRKIEGLEEEKRNLNAEVAELKKEVEEMFKVKVDNVRVLIRGNHKNAYVRLNKKNPAIDVATKIGMI
jgi:predicted RNase H-like nuclease (RuvC/YqgF family)